MIDPKFLEIILALGVSGAPQCPPAFVVNRTPEWNETDEKSLFGAEKACAKKYPNSPCVKKFVKIAENDYQVVCGKP